MPVILVYPDTKGWCGSTDGQRSRVTDLVTSWSEGAPSQGTRLVSAGCLLLSAHQLVGLQTPRLTSVVLFPWGIHDGCLMLNGITNSTFYFSFFGGKKPQQTLLYIIPRRKQRKYTLSPAFAKVGILISLCSEPDLHFLPLSCWFLTLSISELQLCNSGPLRDLCCFTPVERPFLKAKLRRTPACNECHPVSNQQYSFQGQDLSNSLCCHTLPAKPSHTCGLEQYRKNRLELENKLGSKRTLEKLGKKLHSLSTYSWFTRKLYNEAGLRAS